MKTIFVLASLILSTSSWASPKVVASFVSMNTKLCVAIASDADTCQIAMTNTQKLKSKLAELDPNSFEYKKWAAMLPQIQNIEASVCETANDGSKYEMAVANVNFDASFDVTASKLDKGIFGRVELSPSQVLGDLIHISSATVQMTVYGNIFCQAVVKAGGDTSKALESIAAGIQTQN